MPLLPIRFMTGRVAAVTLTVALTWTSFTGCDRRRTTDLATCDMDAFDPTGALTTGETDFTVTLATGQQTKPHKVPNGRWVTPLGKTLKLHTFPIRVAAHPGGRYYAVNNAGIGDLRDGWQSISVVDGEMGLAVTTAHAKCLAGEPCDALPVEQLFGDLLFSSDGTKLYAAGGGANQVLIFDTSDVAAPATTPTAISVPNYPTGLALLPGDRELLVTGFHKHALYRIDLDAGKVVKTYAVQIYPYGVTTDGAFAYVSNLGANSVSKVDLESGKLSHLLVGINPEGVALARDGKTLYVANSDSDSLSVIDTAAFTTDTTRTVSLKNDPDDAIGRSPVDVQLSRDGKRIYVVLAGDNAVAVLRASDLSLIGMIPTAWYPTTLAENIDGSQLAIVSAKGFGAGSNDPRKFNIENPNPYNDVFVGRLQKGLVSLTEVPSDAHLAAMHKTVDDNNNVTRHLFKAGCERVRNPVPLTIGQSSPIKHVVYIVRENKTYDSNLGDYPGVANKATGDPSLAIWGKRVTPNLRKLAERFANHDNYYSEPEQSIQGHIWAANGWSNDFSEKVWMAMWSNKRDSLFLPAIEHASRGGGGNMILNVLKAGRDVRIYGEISGLADELTTTLRDKVNWKFPAYSLHIRDREKAKIFIDDLDKGIFPEFVYIWLPNDHTSGCSEGRPYPVSEIMDNDEATGMVVDAISKSRFWKETAVFVFEDDPQSAPDHVDAHRSLLVVASPYAKRGWTSKVHLSFPSIHRTMGLILGVPATSRYEELATPMYDSFRETADLEPFDYIPMDEKDFVVNKPSDGDKITVNDVEYFNCREIGAKFLKPNSLDVEDQIPGLGRILWYHARGDMPYPEALVADGDD